MRTLLHSVIATVGVVGLVGCVGELESEPGIVGTNPNPKGSNSMAAKLFAQTVYPIINAPGQASDCSQCHDSKAPVGNVTGFVSATADESYATLTSFQSLVGNFTPTAAGILSRIAPTDIHTTTRGRMYTDAQRQAITDWLAADLAERGNNTTTTDGPGAETAKLLNQWTACMTLANWQAAQMTTAWGNLVTDDGDMCVNCHATGGQGMMVSNVEESIGTGVPGMWSVVSTKEPYLIQYFSVDFTGAMPQVIINTESFKGVATGTPPHTEHPMFDPLNNPGMQALQQFYQLTHDSLGGCDASATKLSPPAT